MIVLLNRDIIVSDCSITHTINMELISKPIMFEVMADSRNNEY